MWKLNTDHVKGRTANRRFVVRSHARGRALPAAEAVAHVRAGLPVAELDALRELLGVTVEALAGKVGISIATLSRRRNRREPLDVGQSDRVLRYARLFRQAVTLHDGDEDAARAWLKSPARALGGETPLERAETEVGAREVENLMGRLEHSVYT
jgi:putative toxin-antitoxin system antitoxin component (TIGR02293 family)